MRVEQDGGRLRFVHVYPQPLAIVLEPVLHVESAAAHAQCGVRADDKDGAARCPSLLRPKLGGATGWSLLEGRRGQPPRSRSCAAQLLGERRAGARPRGRSGIRAPRVGCRGIAYISSARPSPRRLANRKRFASPMEQDLAGARGPRQMRRYLIFCACAAI